MRHLLAGILALAAALCALPASADDAPAVTLTVKQDQARVADALNVLQQETGQTIVVDSTVIGRMGSAKVSFPTLAKMLDFLKTTEPGLTYTQIYITQNKPTPSADDCYNLVRTMEWLADQGNPVLVSPTATISVSSQPGAPASTPPGMRPIWYVSDEQIRAQEVLDQQKIAQQAAQQAAEAASNAAQNTNPRPVTRRPVNRQNQNQYQLAPGLTIVR